MTIKSKAFKFLLGIAVVIGVAVAASFASAADFGTATLRVGSRGAAVMEVQKLVGVTADGSYGPMTEAAVKAWQANVGLYADGIFGPASRAKAYELAGSTGTVVTVPGCPAGAVYNYLTGAACGTTTTPVVTVPSVLQGEEADLSWDLFEEDDLNQDVKDQHAFTIEIEADRDGGDAKIERLDIQFSSDATLYRAISKVALEVDGDVIAEVDTDSRLDWRGSSDVVRLSGLDLVVKSGKTVEVEVLLDVTDKPTNIDIEEVSYRYTDSTGYVETGDAGLTGSVAVEAAEELSFRITENKNNPSDMALDVSSSRTNETLAIVDVEVRDGEGTIEDVIVDIEFTGTGTGTGTGTAIVDDDVEELLSRVSLKIDGDQVDYITSYTVSSDVITLSFDADEFDIEEDDDFTIEVLGNFRSYDAGLETLQVTRIELNGFDIGADDDFTSADVSSAEKDISSFAPVFTLTEGDVYVFISDVEVRKTSDHGGDIVFDLEVENDTGEGLLLATKVNADGVTLETLKDWVFDVKGYGVTTTAVVLDEGTLYNDADGDTSLGVGDAYLLDGDIVTFEVTLTYTSTSTASFSIEVEKIGGVALGYIWAD